MSSADITYDTLVELIPQYAERVGDAQFEAQVPTFIMLAENRIATDLKQQGFQAVVTGTFGSGAGAEILAKPAYWRETVSFTYTNASGESQALDLRSLEYVKAFWPAAASTGQPRLYADYNINNFLVAPTPDAAYSFVLAYMARLTPLSATNQVNWTTYNAPQVLVAACMYQAALFTKTVASIERWKGVYAESVVGLVQENQERLSDRNQVVSRP